MSREFTDFSLAPVHNCGIIKVYLLLTTAPLIALNSWQIQTSLRNTGEKASLYPVVTLVLYFVYNKQWKVPTTLFQSKIMIILPLIFIIKQNRVLYPTGMKHNLWQMGHAVSDSEKWTLQENWGKWQKNQKAMWRYREIRFVRTTQKPLRSP